MKRTTVYLDDRTDLELARLARQQGRSKAELIREALAAHVATAARESQGAPDWVGMVDSGGARIAERDEELFGKLLEEEYDQILTEWHARRQRERSR